MPEEKSCEMCEHCDWDASTVDFSCEGGFYCRTLKAGCSRDNAYVFALICKHYTAKPEPSAFAEAWEHQQQVENAAGNYLLPVGSNARQFRAGWKAGYEECKYNAMKAARGVWENKVSWHGLDILKAIRKLDGESHE